ncbi:RnaseH [Synechococcus phage S-CREM1]|nr:RnaseH [Synechococcus phage S-CREM1]
MILIDMNQVMISNLMVQIQLSNELDKGLVRHMVLNSLRMYNQKFGEEYGELVLCYDSKRYWRREFFPFYKGTRKKDREKSSFNWGSIFEILNEIRDEIREYMPYKVMEVEGAEADDIISVLTKYQAMINIRLQKDMQPITKVLILSGDKDFIQLQKYPWLKQYNPVMKKFVTGMDPKKYILEHVLKGDKSDGIPNYLSPDNTFVEGKRQRPLTKKNLDRIINLSPEQFCNEEQLENYKRNLTLIDFSYIPVEVEEKILESYDSVTHPPRNKMYNYFVKQQLINLLDKIGEF